MKDRALELIRVFGDPAAAVVLQVHDKGELLPIDPGLVVDVAGRIGERDRLRAERDQFVHRVLRDVAAAGDQTGLALQLFLARLQHLRPRNRPRRSRSPRDE